MGGAGADYEGNFPGGSNYFRAFDYAIKAVVVIIKRFYVGASPPNCELIFTLGKRFASERNFLWPRK